MRHAKLFADSIEIRLQSLEPAEEVHHQAILRIIDKFVLWTNKPVFCGPEFALKLASKKLLERLAFGRTKIFVKGSHAIPGIPRKGEFEVRGELLGVEMAAMHIFARLQMCKPRRTLSGIGIGSQQQGCSRLPSKSNPLQEHVFDALACILGNMNEDAPVLMRNHYRFN